VSLSAKWQLSTEAHIIQYSFSIIHFSALLRVSVPEPALSGAEGWLMGYLQSEYSSEKKKRLC
jgi:hypothetical protein